MEIISRKQAKERGLKRYFTGKPCKRGHVAERYCISKLCVECRIVLSRQSDYMDKARKRQAKKRKQEPERCKAEVRKWIKENPERYRQLQRRPAEELRDCYIRDQIVRATNIKKSDITPEMIELKREKITIYRLLREIKNGLNGKRDSRTENDDIKNGRRDNQARRD